MRPLPISNLSLREPGHWQQTLARLPPISGAEGQVYQVHRLVADYPRGPLDPDLFVTHLLVERKDRAVAGHGCSVQLIDAQSVKNQIEPYDRAWRCRWHPRRSRREPM